MTVLVHACCGPCSVYPADALGAEGLAFAFYFYNPNIHPYQEYERRRAAMQQLAETRGVPLILDDRYDPESWFRMTAFREAERCRFCYHTRLLAAAAAARQGGYDSFTTTLLYSKRQKHELARELADAVAEEVGVPFLYRDFRTGWQAGIQGSREMGLYRQNYCGCLFSERDRFQPRSARDAGGGDP